MVDLKAFLTRCVTEHKHALIIAPHFKGLYSMVRHLVDIMPKPTELEAIYEAAGLMGDSRFCNPFDYPPHKPPFRAPHWTTTIAGIIGAQGRPGEVSLAHEGIMYLDDLNLYRNLVGLWDVLSGARQIPWPHDAVVIARIDPGVCVRFPVPHESFQ